MLILTFKSGLNFGGASEGYHPALRKDINVNSYVSSIKYKKAHLLTMFLPLLSYPIQCHKLWINRKRAKIHLQLPT